MPVPPCPPASRTCGGLKGARSVFDCAGLLQTSSSSSASRPCSGSQTWRTAVTVPTPALPWPLLPWPLRASPASTAPVQFQQSFRMLLQVHLCPSLQEPHTASLEPQKQAHLLLQFVPIPGAGPSLRRPRRASAAFMAPAPPAPPRCRRTCRGPRVWSPRPSAPWMGTRATS